MLTKVFQSGNSQVVCITAHYVMVMLICGGVLGNSRWE